MLLQDCESSLGSSAFRREGVLQEDQIEDRPSYSSSLSRYPDSS